MSQQQISVPAYQLGWGDIIHAWRGTWRVLGPMYRLGERHFLRVVDAYSDAPGMVLRVRPEMQLATLRRGPVD